MAMEILRRTSTYFMTSILLTRRVLPVSTEFSRNYVRRKRKKTWSNEWADPIYEYANKQKIEREPSMLHIVYRVKPLKGRPYWERDTIKRLQLEGPLNKPVVHKNTPAVNNDLKIVKHLVKIVPMTFPYGFPEDESDLEHCYLRDNGEFVVVKKVDVKCIEDVMIREEVPGKVWDFDRDTLRNEAERKKMNYDLLTEYFKPKYRYKFNQDGKEHRYFGDHNICSDRDWY